LTKNALDLENVQLLLQVTINLAKNACKYFVYIF
jgi:hypothetical protein